MDNLEIPSFVIDKQKKNLEDFKEYQEMARENRNPIFDEVRQKERLVNRKKNNEKRIRIQKFKRYTALTILLLAGTFALKKEIDKQVKPINIVAHDILANENLLKTDNGKNIEPKKFQEYQKQELYSYIIKNDLTNKEVVDNIKNYCEKEGISYDFALEQVKEDYPGLFGPKIEITK